MTRRFDETERVDQDRVARDQVWNIPLSDTGGGISGGGTIDRLAKWISGVFVGNSNIIEQITGDLITLNDVPITGPQTYTFPDATGGFALGAGDVTSSTLNDATGANHVHALDTLIGSPGTYGSATQVPRTTVDAKGRVTAISNVTIAIPPSAITGGVRGDILRREAALWVAYSAKTNGAALIGDGTDVISTLTPVWLGEHNFAGGAQFPDNINLVFGTSDDATIDYNDGNLAVTVNGADWLMTINDLHLQDATAFKPRVTLESTSAGADPPTLLFNHNSASPADNDDLGIIEFTGKSDTAAVTRYAYILGESLDVTNADTAGGIRFVVDVNTAARDILKLSGYNGTVGQGEVIVNEEGIDIDFRVEAIGHADALEIQGSDGQVTLGVLTAGLVVSDASGVLSVEGPASVSGLAGDGLTWDAGNDEIDLGTPSDITATSANTVGAVTHSHNAVTVADGAANHSTILQSSAAGAITLDDLFLTDGAVVGISAADERLEFNAAGDIQILGANLGVGGTPSALLTITANNASPLFDIERVDAVVGADNSIGQIRWRAGEAGSDNVGRLRINADAAWTATSSPTRMTFEVTEAGNTAVSEALRITSELNMILAAGYIELNEISSPGASGANELFINAIDDGGVTALQLTNSSGNYLTANDDAIKTTEETFELWVDTNGINVLAKKYTIATNYYVEESFDVSARVALKNIDNILQTILPAGTVQTIMRFDALCERSGVSDGGQSGTVAPGASALFFDDTTNQWTIAVTAGGAVTVQRTASTGTVNGPLDLEYS